MAVIKLINMGGLFPSVAARALPEHAGQTAINLMVRTPEFRPLQADVTAATLATGDPSNPKTLYRMARDANGAYTSDMSKNWKANAAEVNYVKGQINDDAKERTYYTYADGSAPPRVMDATGADKPMGVPVPVTAPTGKVNSVFSYSPEARTAQLAKARDDAVAIILKNSIISWKGVTFGPGNATSPGNTTPGYMNQDGISDPMSEDNAKIYRVFKVASPNSTDVVDSFTSARLTVQAKLVKNAAGDILSLGVFDPRLTGRFTQAVGPYGSTTWFDPNNTGNTSAYCVPFVVYGRTYDFDVATVATALAAITMPGTGELGPPPTPPARLPLLTPALATKFAQQIKDTCGPTSPRVSALLNALNAEAQRFHQILDEGSASSIEQVVEEQARLQVLSDAVGLEYEKIYAELPAKLEQFYFANGIDSTVPPGIPRIIEDRFYITTYVTDWDEESAPSPVSQMAELDQNDTVTGSPPNPPAGYGINRFRYYRTNTGNAGAAFQFVGEATFSPASLSGGALTTIVDDKKSTELGEVCPTLTWLPPPYRMDSARAPKGANPYMRGLVGLANGVMAGFFDNTVCFSESYIPYAYPVEYQITTAFPIVALGAFGQTAVVFHTGGVDYISGSDSQSMSHDKNVSLYACIARRSIANSREGVCYASNNGICLASRNGVQLLTESQWVHEDWLKLNPGSIVGAVHDATYFFTYNNGTPGCYALNIDSGTLVALDVAGSALYTDIQTDRLYTVQGKTVIALFSNSTTTRKAAFKSKIAVLQQYASFAWLVIESNFESPITVRWWGDGVMRHQVDVMSRAPVRLPAGRYLEHEIEVVTSARWNSLTIASSTTELQQV